MAIDFGFTDPKVNQALNDIVAARGGGSASGSSGGSGLLDPLAVIRRFESGGGTDPAGSNVPNFRFGPGYTAQGYYQITNSTWAGIPASITQGYSNAMSAPYDVQTNAAAYLYNTQGFQPWICAGCNPQLASYINQQGGPSAYIAAGNYVPSSTPGGQPGDTGGATPGLSIDAGPEFNPGNPATADQPINPSTFNPLFSNPSGLPLGSADTFNPLFSKPAGDPASGTTPDTSGTGASGT